MIINEAAAKERARDFLTQVMNLSELRIKGYFVSYVQESDLFGEPSYSIHVDLIDGTERFLGVCIRTGKVVIIY